jgi:hypothetical protein
MDESGVVWQLVFLQQPGTGKYVCVSVSLEKKIVPREREAQWWSSKCYFYFFGKTLKTSTAISKKKKSDFNSTIWSMYDIGLFLFTGVGWACGIPSVFTQIYLCFSAAKDFFSAMVDWGGCVFTQFCLWPGLVYLPLRFIISAHSRACTLVL